MKMSNCNSYPVSMVDELRLFLNVGDYLPQSYIYNHQIVHVELVT